jgi:hypothetical protein
MSKTTYYAYTKQQAIISRFSSLICSNNNDIVRDTYYSLRLADVWGSGGIASPFLDPTLD